jgi:hypothetical protein
MKGMAIGRRMKVEKDIYAVAGFHKGSPVNAAREFNRLISIKSGGRLRETTVRALDRIYRGFESRNAYASQAATRFIGSDISTDAAERVKAFRDGIQQPRIEDRNP